MKNLLGLFAMLSFLGACTHGPLHQKQWSEKWDPLSTSVVFIQSGTTFDRAFGNGIIVHSTREQGTYLLTTAGIMASENPQALMYDYTREAPDVLREETYRLEVVAQDRRRDLALVRVVSRGLFKTAKFHREDLPAHYAERRLDVRTVFIGSEGYPRVKNVPVTSNGRWEPGGLQAVRGCPVFCEGKLIGLYSEEGSAHVVPPREVREFLQDFGYGFIISVD